MRTAFYGVDVIDKGVDVLIERGVVGHSHLNGNAALVAVDVNHIVDERFLAGINVAYEFIKTCAAVVSLAHWVALLVVLAQVGEGERYTGIQIGQVTKSVRERVEVINGLLEYAWVGMEYHGCSVFFFLAGAHDSDWSLWLTLGILLHIHLAFAAHLCPQIITECVHTAHANAVQTA